GRRGGRGGGPPGDQDLPELVHPPDRERLTGPSPAETSRERRPAPPGGVRTLGEPGVRARRGDRPAGAAPLGRPRDRKPRARRKRRALADAGRDPDPPSKELHMRSMSTPRTGDSLHGLRGPAMLIAAAAMFAAPAAFGQSGQSPSRDHYMQAPERRDTDRSRVRYDDDRYAYDRDLYD